MQVTVSLFFASFVFYFKTVYFCLYNHTSFSCIDSTMVIKRLERRITRSHERQPSDSCNFDVFEKLTCACFSQIVLQSIYSYLHLNNASVVSTFALLFNFHFIEKYFTLQSTIVEIYVQLYTLLIQLKNNTN